MPPPLTYSWIALAASAPVILLLTTWTLAVFHCRRRQWSSIDIFLVSILSQSVLQQFLGFIYSILSLIKLSSKSTGDTICTGLLWFFISIPIFKGATIVSLAIDRWLFAAKFEYRLYLRKNHIRYHIGVLAVLSSTVGFAALLTLNSPDLLTDNSWLGSSTYSFDQCTFIPFKFDLKFVIFYIGVHTIIVVTGLFAIWKASCCNCGGRPSREKQLEQSHTNHRRIRKHVPLDLTPTLSNTSTASSSVSADNPVILQFSTPGLRAKAVLSHLPPEQQQQQQKSKILVDRNHPSKRDAANHHRESTSMGLLVLTIIFTHAPLLASTTFSTYLMNSGTTPSDHWSIIPLNWPVTNILLWSQVVEGLVVLLILLTVDSIVPTWIFQCKKHKQRNFQQLFQPNLTNITTMNTKKNYPNPYQLNNNTMAAQSKATSGLASEYKNNKFPITNGSLFASLTAAAVAAASSAPNKVLGNDNPSSDNGNIYMSLSNDFDSIATASIDQISLDGEDDEDSKKYYHQRCASVTTVANDDFEFHHALPLNQVMCPPPPFNPRTFTLNKNPKQSIYGLPVQPYTSYGQNVQFLPSQQPYQHPQPLTSLSMNDLDLITELEASDNVSTSKPPNATVEYKQQRMYRKRPRLHYAQSQVHSQQQTSHQPPISRSQQRQPLKVSDRRVLSLECLSSNLYHANKNGFDVSYLDTGDLCLVRQGDGSRCIFVTDFI